MPGRGLWPRVVLERRSDFTISFFAYRVSLWSVKRTSRGKKRGEQDPIPYLYRYLCFGETKILHIMNLRDEKGARFADGDVRNKGL